MIKRIVLKNCFVQRDMFKIHSCEVTIGNDVPKINGFAILIENGVLPNYNSINASISINNTDIIANLKGYYVLPSYIVNNNHREPEEDLSVSQKKRNLTELIQKLPKQLTIKKGSFLKVVIEEIEDSSPNAIDPRNISFDLVLYIDYSL